MRHHLQQTSRNRRKLPERRPQTLKTDPTESPPARNPRRDSREPEYATSNQICRLDLRYMDGYDPQSPEHIGRGEEDYQGAKGNEGRGRGDLRHRRTASRCRKRTTVKSTVSSSERENRFK